MFASPKNKKKAKVFASNMDRNVIDRSLSDILIPHIKNKIQYEENSFTNTPSKDDESIHIDIPPLDSRPSKVLLGSPLFSIRNTLKFLKKANRVAFTLDRNDNYSIDVFERLRGYKILSFVVDEFSGKTTVFDPFDGKVYNCETRKIGSKYPNRFSSNVIVFDNKLSAISEKFPSSQIGIGKGGNGTLPRVLVQFDCWGKIQKRIGGGSALQAEFVKFIGIVKFMDPLVTISKQRSRTFMEPYYFSQQEHVEPSRMISPREIKLDLSFDSLVSERRIHSSQGK